MHFLNRLVSLAVTGLILLPASLIRASDAPDPATPKGVLYAFGEAIAKTDMPAAKALTPGTADDVKMIDLFAAVGTSQRKLHDAAEKKFGKDEITTVGTGSAVAAARFKDSENWDENIVGEIATLTHKPGPSDPPVRPGAKPSPPAKLRKVDGVWKLDLSSMVPAEQRDVYFKTLTILAKVGDEIADEIRADKYPSGDAAKAAYRGKLMAGLRAQMTPPAGKKPGAP